VPELRDPGAAELLLIPGQVRGPELEPCSPEALIVRDGVTRRALGSKVGELRAAPGSVAEAGQHDRIRKTKISLDDLTPKRVAEQRRECTALARSHEQVHPRAESPDAWFMLIHNLSRLARGCSGESRSP